MCMQSTKLIRSSYGVCFAVMWAGVLPTAFAQPAKDVATAPGYGDQLEQVLARAVTALENADHAAFIGNMFPPSVILQAKPGGTTTLAEQFKAQPKLAESMLKDLKLIQGRQPDRMEQDGNVAVFVMSEPSDGKAERLVKFQKIAGSWRFFDSTSQIAKQIRTIIRGTDGDEKWQQADKLTADIGRIVLLIESSTKKAAEAAAQAKAATDVSVAGDAARVAAAQAATAIQAIKNALDKGAQARKLAATAEGAGLRNQMRALSESTTGLMRRGFESLKSKEIARRAAAKLSPK